MSKLKLQPPLKYVTLVRRGRSVSDSLVFDSNGEGVR